MNRFYTFLSCAIGCILFTSCSSEEIDEMDNTPRVMTFRVAAPDSDNTRAVVYNLESPNPTVNWEETDQVLVWGSGSTASSTFNFTGFGNYKNYGLFVGEYTKADKYYIMYPNQEGATFDGSSIISATIPSCQKATPMSFDPAAALCTGATEGQEDTSVSIAHACAFLKITTTAPCYSVTVTPAGNNNGKEWLVTGGVKLVTSSSGCKINIEDSSTGKSYVKLTADGTENCKTTFPAGTYLMAIASSTKFPGIHIVVDYGLDNNPEVTKYPEGGIQFNAAFVYNLGTANAPVSTPEKMSFLVGNGASTTRAAISEIESPNPLVEWQETDQVFVWGLNNTTGSVFKFKSFGNYHNYGLFEGVYTKSPKYFIMYPYQEGATFDGNGIISATIPPTQKATLNSFDPNAALCTGATEGQEDSSVSIAHACAFLKITTKQDCKSILFKPVGNNSNGNPWHVTGDVKLETSSSGCKINIEDTERGYNYVKLTADGTEDCATTFPKGTYVMAIASSTKFPGFEVIVDYGLGDKNPHVIKEYDKQFNAGFIYSLGEAVVNTGE